MRRSGNTSETIRQRFVLQIVMFVIIDGRQPLNTKDGKTMKTPVTTKFGFTSYFYTRKLDVIPRLATPPPPVQMSKTDSFDNHKTSVVITESDGPFVKLTVALFEKLTHRLSGDQTARDDLVRPRLRRQGTFK